MVGLVRDMHQMLAKLTMKPIRPPSTATTWHRKRDEGVQVQGGEKEGWVSGGAGVSHETTNTATTWHSRESRPSGVAQGAIVSGGGVSEGDAEQ